MLFNSLEFALFLPLVFLFYWFVVQRSVRLRNAFLIAASYLFYGWWDWRFLSLIVISSAVDFAAGLGMERASRPRARKALLAGSLLVNLGFLGFFKYYNFFLDSLVEAFSALGVTLHASTLQVVLPVGISFYTFQTLSYTIDIYRGRVRPTRDPLAFFAFVAFFPQLVAGPIERAKNLLPQFERPRRFDPEAATDGLRQMLYGLFKKVVIADGLALIVDRIFAEPAGLQGSTLALGAVFFTVQIYCDFSGYSDIAIGTARLLGFDLMRNFAFPFFSRDIAEFWRRWHISLSTWFRDYLFIPLGGSRGGRWRHVRNVFATFTVSGLWHGASWTFVIWGALNALYYMPLLLLGRQRQHEGTVAEGRLVPGLGDAARVGTTFALTAFAFVFFRSPTLDHALGYLAGMASPSLLALPELGKSAAAWLVPFAAFEWVQRERRHGLEIPSVPRAVRWPVYWALAFSVLVYFQQEKSFIYFQF